MTQGPAEQVGTSVDMLRNPRGNNEELSLARFLEPERLAAIRASTKSSVTGVGLEIAFESEGSNSSGEIVVLSPQQGGPADRCETPGLLSCLPAPACSTHVRLTSPQGWHSSGHQDPSG